MTITVERFEVIVRRHIIEQTPEHRSTKSRRYNIYQRVFDEARSDEVIRSVERTLNGKESEGDAEL